MRTMEKMSRRHLSGWYVIVARKSHSKSSSVIMRSVRGRRIWKATVVTVFLILCKKLMENFTIHGAN